MRGSSLGYLIRKGISNIWLNRMMSAASIGILTACLILFIGLVTFFSYSSLRRELTGYTRDAVAYLTDCTHAEHALFTFLSEIDPTAGHPNTVPGTSNNA